MSLKTWSAGEELLATDLNANFTEAIGRTQISLLAGEDISAGESVILGDGVEDAFVITQDSQDSNYSMNATTKQLSQSFTTTADTTKIVSVEIYCNSVVGGEGNGIVTIFLADGSDEPTGGSLGTITISKPDINPNVYNVFIFASPISLNVSTKYVVVLSTSVTDSGNYNRWDYKDTTAYANGLAKVSVDSGSSWSVLGTSADLRFKVNLTEQDTTAGSVYLSDASNDDRFANNFVGFADETITSGNSILINIQGFDNNQSGLSPGLTYYLSDTPGAIASSTGSQSRIIGRALSATKIKIINDF